MASTLIDGMRGLLRLARGAAGAENTDRAVAALLFSLCASLAVKFKRSRTQRKRAAARLALKGSRRRPVPVSQGYYMPAEWRRHEATWMLWPYRADNWVGNAEPARAEFADVARAVAQFERVFVCVPSGHLDSAERHFRGEAALVESAEAARASGGRLFLVVMESDDAWMRDVGPTFLLQQLSWRDASRARLAAVDWRFNAWGGLDGGCYDSWEQDDRIASQVISLAGALRFRTEMVLEGGAIHCDGEGTVIAVEECLTHANRNPNMRKAEIEAMLLAYLGCEKLIWLPRGVYGDDDTNGHVDNLACFVRPGCVALAWTEDRDDPQYERSVEALEALRRATDARGRPIAVHKITMPPPMFYGDSDVEPGVTERRAGDRLPGSYINFYICNGGVIVPQFGVPSDAAAAEQIQALFPDRRVVPVGSRSILLGGGNIHCITQQQPAT